MYPQAHMKLPIIGVLLLSVATASCIRQDNESPVSAEEASPELDSVHAPLDEKGRWIVRLGTLEMHIPRKLYSQARPMSEYQIFGTVICLREHESGAECSDTNDQIRIFLFARPQESPTPACNAEDDHRTAVLQGPYPTGHPNVDLYQSESTASRTFVYRIPEEGCWYPKARCNALRCTASFTPRPGVTVRYEFSDAAIDRWPSIHDRVRSLVDAFFPED